MPIPAICPSCGRTTLTPAETAGRSIECPGCHRTVPVPAMGILAPPAKPRRRRPTATSVRSSSWARKTVLVLAAAGASAALAIAILWIAFAPRPRKTTSDPYTAPTPTDETRLAEAPADPSEQFGPDLEEGTGQEPATAPPPEIKFALPPVGNEIAINGDDPVSSVTESIERLDQIAEAAREKLRQARSKANEPTRREDQEPAASAPRPIPRGLDLVRQKIFDLTNQLRRQEGRGELKSEPRLIATAQDFAEFMARTGTFSHTADGKHPWDRGKEHGYAYCRFSENIALVGTRSRVTVNGLSNVFVSGWEHSPGHRKNMLDADVDEIGIGIAYNTTTNRYYAVQNFGRPKSGQVVFRVTNETEDTVAYTVLGKAISLSPHHTATHYCDRPPVLDLQPTGAGQPPNQFRPVNGSRYTIQKGSDGGFFIRAS